MNHEESIKSKILGRFFRKMLTAGVLCMGVLVGCLVLGKSILGSGMFLAALLCIGIFYWVKLLNYFQEVMDAMEGLAGEERPIRLRPELTEVQQHMNEVQHQIHKNERLAKEAEQRKNDLVVYLAHDLKTPLTSVIGYLTLW